MILFGVNDLVVTIHSFSEAYIDSVIDDDGGMWRFTSFYGHPRANSEVILESFLDDWLSAMIFHGL